MRGAEAWLGKRPGNIDALHLDPTYEVPRGANAFGLPMLLGDDIMLDGYHVVPYDRSNRRPSKKKLLHFFVDDYRFETFWNQPKYSLQVVREFGAVTSPDFSCYVDWPWAINLWNVYRSRWLGVYWQRHGVCVIPSVTWGNERTHTFAFLGIPDRATVAIAVPDLRGRRSMTRLYFYTGFEAMLDTIQPVRVLVYGRVTKGMGRLASRYPTELYPVKPTRPHTRRKPRLGRRRKFT